jgi:L-aminopeptidase/D-esterase-like protein
LPKGASEVQVVEDAITDVAGIKVGHWTDLGAATGCTVVLCEAGAMPGVDVRGAASGTIGTDALRPGSFLRELHAVVLSGGSAFGLSTAAGVTRWCEETGIGLSFGGQRIPIVAGAILFDLLLGAADVRPDPEAGYAAAAAAKGGAVEQGSVGAGTGATVAKLLGREGVRKGGIGTASEAFGDGLAVGALFAVNCVGDVIDSATGKVIAGARSDSGLDTIAALRAGRPGRGGSNTTLGVVATNARLDKEQTNRLATIAHNGLARAVRPAHTMMDGDTIFTMATGERELSPDRILALETFATLAVERAIVKGVLAATSLGGVPSVREAQQRP